MNQDRPNHYRRYLTKKPGKIMLAVLVVMVGAYLWKNSHRQTFFDTQVLGIVSFPLYYPSQLPADYQPTPDSMRTTSNLLTFSVALVNGEKLAFSEQPRPQNFNFDNFNTQQVASPSKIDTPIGSGIIGTFSGAKIASIPTGKTWIIITAPYGIADAQLRQIAQGLKLAN